MTPAEARSQAAAEWAHMDALAGDVDEYIRRFPTLDADGWPLESDPYLDEQAEYLLGQGAAGREEWIAERTAELLAGNLRRTA